MHKKVKLDVQYPSGWDSLGTSMFYIVRHCGMWDAPGGLSEFMGMSGLAFQFLVPHRCSLDAGASYGGAREHSSFFSRIGIRTEYGLALPKEPDYPAACRIAERKIKQSLDAGRGVVLWGIGAPQHGIIHGYDEEEQIFYISGPGTSDSTTNNPVLFSNLGRTFQPNPILYCIYPVGSAACDGNSAQRSSLQYYVNHMSAKQSLGNNAYTGGLDAYDYWIHALETENYRDDGVRFLAGLFAERKSHALFYGASLDIPAMKKRILIDLWNRISIIFLHMHFNILEQDFFGWDHFYKTVSASQAKQIQKSLLEAKRLEQQAVATAAQIVDEWNEMSRIKQRKQENAGRQSVTIFAAVGPDSRKLFDLAKEKFEESHSGVTVNLVTKSITKAEDFFNQLEKQMSSGQPADIVYGIGSLLVRLGWKGELRDLTPLARMNAVCLEDYYESGLLEHLRINCKLIAIPTNASPVVVMYNKSTFKAAGIPEPPEDWTWDDFAEIAKKLQAALPDPKKPFATVFPLANTQLSALAISNGGAFLSPDGSTFKGYLDSQESVQAIEWYAGLVRGRIFNPQYIFNTPARLSGGDTAMYVSTYNEVRILPRKKNETVGILVLPAFSVQNRAVAVSGSMGGLAIPEKSNNPQLAWEFIQFLTMEKNAVTEEAAQTYVMDVPKKVIPSIENDPFQKVKLDSRPYLKKDLAGANPNFLTVQFPLHRRLQQIVMYSSDFQKDLTALAESMDTELKKAGVMPV